MAAPLALQIHEGFGSLLPSNATIWVSGCSAESLVLAAMAGANAHNIAAPTFTGIFVDGVNQVQWASAPDARLLTYFRTREARALAERCVFRPLCYADIHDDLVRNPPDAALFMVSPPNASGLCSFGSCVDFIADIWPKIPVRIAHINPAMPHTGGDTGIPFYRLTAFIEAHQSLRSIDEGSADPVTDQIAANVARLIPDGATLQTGLGKLPGAVLRALTRHRGLAIHSGLIGDAVLDLADAGALRPGQSITGGVSIGSRRLYDRIADPIFAFHGPSITHDVTAIGRIDKFIAINSAIEVDLFGQAYAELGPRGFQSGPGGALDFSRGARLSAGGLRIVVLPSSAKGKARIVMPPGRGPVSLGRMDIDLVVTEHGAADLRCLDYGARAGALIAIAAPEHRPGLQQQWHDFQEQEL